MINSASFALMLSSIIAKVDIQSQTQYTNT